MRSLSVFLVATVVVAHPAHAQPREVSVKVSFGQQMGPHGDRSHGARPGGALGRTDVGQPGRGGSGAPAPLDPALRAGVFPPSARAGRTHFETLDRSVDTILKAGAKPLMCLCFKPKILFPTVDQDQVEPDDYGEWERLVSSLVKHYRNRGAGIRYWEVANEPDIGESGGCPYRFKPESYARYYRHTAEAILRADPEARVGGPALANVRSPIFPALLDACDDGQSPLHFVSWHIYSSDPGRVRGTISYAQELLKKHPSSSRKRFWTNGTWICKTRRSTRGSSPATCWRPSGR